MADPSATAALDAYLARQTSSKSASSSQAGQRASSTRAKRTGYENATELGRRGSSGLRADTSRHPLQDRSQLARKNSSLGQVSDSQRQPADLPDRARQKEAHSQFGRFKAVWPPSPLDEVDETPLLEKLHPATSRSLGVASGPKKASLQALQKLKRVPSSKGVAQQSTGYQHSPADRSIPMWPAVQQPTAAILDRREPTRHAAHETQQDTAESRSTQPAAVSEARSNAAQAASSAQDARPGAQHTGTVPEPPRAFEPQAAPQAWRRARWDASADAEDTRALDSLIPRQRAPPSRQPDVHPAGPGTARPGHLAAHMRGHMPHASHAAAASVPQASSAQIPAAAASAGAGRGVERKDGAVPDAADGASVLAEVLAELRAEEDSQGTGRFPGSGGMPVADGAGSTSQGVHCDLIPDVKLTC